MMIFSCELAVSILALIIIVVMELKLRTEKRRLELEADLELIQKLWQLESKMSVVILIAQRDLCVMKSVCNLTREIRR